MSEAVSKKILVVDDSILERELIIEILKAQGVKNDFLQAANAEEAIDALGHHYREIGIILLDWQMPGISGLDFMKGVMALKWIKETPIIMVTAAAEKNNEKQARAVNPHLAGYIIKPYEPEDLLAAIAPYL
jgi:two-component system chemotaxis response regulator CheY